MCSSMLFLNNWTFRHSAATRGGPCRGVKWYISRLEYVRHMEIFRPPTQAQSGEAVARGGEGRREGRGGMSGGAPVVPVNPKPFLHALAGERVVVRLKWGMEYRGLLRSVDAYMNLLLEGADEWERGASKGHLGDVLIRCNNVLYIRAEDTAKRPGDPIATPAIG